MESLPRGRHGLSREEVVASQRTRLLRAVVELSTERGFPSLTLSEIVGRAGVARSTFYEHFANKEDCFLEAFDYAAGRVFERVLAAAPPGGDFPSRVRIYIARLLELCREEPGLVRLFAADAAALGPAASDRQQAIRGRVADGLVALRDSVRHDHPELAPLTRVRAFAIVGAITEVLKHTLYTSGIEALPALQPELTAIVLALHPDRAEQVRAEGPV
jgi:AcrR family transcriptional regulator